MRERKVFGLAGAKAKRISGSSVTEIKKKFKKSKFKTISIFRRKKKGFTQLINLKKVKGG